MRKAGTAAAAARFSIPQCVQCTVRCTEYLFLFLLFFFLPKGRGGFINSFQSGTAIQKFFFNVQTFLNGMKREKLPKFPVPISCVSSICFLFFSLGEFLRKMENAQNAAKAQRGPFNKISGELCVFSFSFFKVGQNGKANANKRAKVQHLIVFFFTRGASYTKPKPNQHFHDKFNAPMKRRHSFCVGMSGEQTSFFQRCTKLRRKIRQPNPAAGQAAILPQAEANKKSTFFFVANRVFDE